MSTKMLRVKTMKYKCFTLIAILVIIFSLGTVAASDNVTSDANLEVSFDSIDGTSVSQDVLTSDSSQINESNDETDLSVRIDVNNTYKGNLFNRAGFEVPWTITVKVNGTTALNTRIYETLSDNMEYVSHNASAGEYDPISGIWSVGDLSSSDSASLTIVTKLKTDGRFKNSVNAVTDSNDIDLSNNVKSLTIKSGTSKSTSNVTETTDDKNDAQHDDHYGSQGGHSVEREIDDDDDIAAEDPPAQQASSGSKMRAAEVSEPTQSSSSGSERSSSSVSKSTDSITDRISDTFESITGSIISLFDSSASDSDKADSNSSNSSSNPQVKSIAKSDYTKIPMLIFGLFLIALIAYFGYNKIKS